MLFRSRFEAFQTAIAAVEQRAFCGSWSVAWGDKQAASAIETASKTATGWIDGLAMLRTWCALAKGWGGGHVKRPDATP